MPEALLQSGSEFDRSKALLGLWLRNNTSARVLSRDALQDYSGEHSFIAGWRLEVAHDPYTSTLDVLLDARFPYSPIRIAFKSEEVYLKWPHVEPGGLLCLPRVDPPTAGLENGIKGALSAALLLIQQCHDPKFVEDELRLEFVSYWNRSDHPDARRVRSLLDITNRTARLVAVWYGENFTLVAETEDQVRSWLSNRFQIKEAATTRGVFGFLDEAPIPPFPDNPAELCRLLEKHCPDVLNLFDELSISENNTVILGAGSPSGDGLIAMRVTAASLKGFRPSAASNKATKMLLWKTRSHVRRIEVDRFDAAWIHGRGLNKGLPALASSNVLIIGCGSLGSQVAMRLAQAGVGGMHLIDPDVLVPANVGRHALGINSVGQHKSSEIAKELRLRFPHMHSIEAKEEKWQSAYDKSRELFDEATLIVACLGEWSADGQLGEWHARSASPVPIAYGWLDEYGSAAHALALTSSGPSLQCILSPSGDLRAPETKWEGDGKVQVEPACGNLFQPYGPIDVAHAEALVSLLCIDILTGTAKPPIHRVYAGTTATLKAEGGEWSSDHLTRRPEAYEGAFEYERAVARCNDCPICAEQP